MTTPNYDINYEDQRFKTVESDKETAINDMNNTYNEMIGASDEYYQDQINAAKDYSKTQQEIQQANTDFAIEQINQQKDQTQKDYTKEQAGAYVDWQKQSDQYGVNAEQQASQGLTNTGYSESSQVSMYNTYQNRLATARDSYNKAVLNYDNAIKDAQLQNNAKLAEIAYNALQTQLELSLQGFQYKNTLVLEQMNKKQELDNTYYARYQDVLNQMNTENSMAEQVRQYNENLALQKQQFEESVRQFEQDYALQLKQYNEDIRQFNEEIKRLKAKDAKEYAIQIKELELKKKELKQEKALADREYKLKKAQLEEEKRQFNKSYNLQKKAVASSSSSGSSYYSTGGGQNTKTKTDKYGNSSTTTNKSDYYFSNGYQPRYVNNTKLSKSGTKVNEVFGSCGKLGSQNIWEANGKYYVWDGSIKDYVDVTAKYKVAKQKKICFKWGS